VAEKKLKMKIQYQMGKNLREQGIPSPHLIHGILAREGVMQSYNQERKMVGSL
jgi:hypothetical protein